MLSDPQSELNHTSSPKTTIVVPVLNEAENVLPLISRLHTTLRNHPTEVLFVDDSKNDDTVSAVNLAQSKFGSDEFSIRVFHRLGAANWGGLSGAVIDGFSKARSNQTIVMDGDLQHPPETIPSMIEAAKSHDLVVSSRYRKGGNANGLSSGLRHIVSRGSTLLAKLIFPIRLREVSDPMTGFFLINRSQLNVADMRPKGFKILLEIVASHPKLSKTEVPLQFAARESGESHGNLKQGLEFFSQLITLRFAYATRRLSQLPKFAVFGMVGGSVFLLGMSILFVLVDIFKLSPLTANAIQLSSTFGLNYVLNRRITWRDRLVTSRAASKFLLSRAGTTLLNYYLYAWLISTQLSFSLLSNAYAYKINYLAANVICLVVVMVINYLISDKWAFAEPAKRPENNRGLANQSGSIMVGSAFVLVIALTTFLYSPIAAATATMALAGLILFAQACLEAWRILYAYRSPQAVDQLKFPKPLKPRERFALIVPARHESAVLEGTLLQLALQNHPSVEIITVLCDDDYETLQVAYKVAKDFPQVTVMQYPLLPGVKPSKPKQLNYVLDQIKNKDFTVVGVIDAEDEVHPELLRHIDTAFRDKSVGVVQGGVQLINHDSSWYSLHNVLEYYRWFSSAMAFQSAHNFMPLGGNTVFIRHKLLQKVGGWPVTLTEDCSLGVLLSTRHNVKTAVYYEPRLATREETPDSLQGLFRQRVRWNQGFYNEWRKGVWRELPGLRQRMLAGYTLFNPVILASINVFLVATLLATFYLDAPVGLVMLMYIPLIPVALLAVVNVIFLYDFGKAFQRKISVFDYAKLLSTYFAYQMVLNAAAFWSIIRELRGDTSWYKTTHSGQHRLQTAYVSANGYDASDLAGDKNGN